MPRIKGREPAASSTARMLAADIINGVYPEGTRLPVESVLADALNVGRSTVREAVKTLVSKGMLAVAPKRGTITRPPSDWSQLDPDLLKWRLAHGASKAGFLSHLSEIRSMFEPFAVELAARRRTDAEVTAIYRALADMREAEPDSAVAIDADIEFHNAVARAAHNPLLLQLANSLEPALRHGFDVAALGIEGAYRANLGLHQAIADAIARQDPTKAADACHTLVSQFNRDRLEDSTISD